MVSLNNKLEVKEVYLTFIRHLLANGGLCNIIIHVVTQKIIANKENEATSFIAIVI